MKTSEHIWLRISIISVIISTVCAGKVNIFTSNGKYITYGQINLDFNEPFTCILKESCGCCGCCSLTSDGIAYKDRFIIVPSIHYDVLLSYLGSIIQISMASQSSDHRWIIIVAISVSTLILVMSAMILCIHKLKGNTVGVLEEADDIIYIPSESADNVRYEMSPHEDTEEQANVDDCFCMESINIQVEPITRLPCNHRFHWKCIFEWFRTGSTFSCPLCRTIPKFPLIVERINPETGQIERGQYPSLL